MATILIIEPDKILRNTHTTALESLGHQVMCAASAQVAVMRCDEQKPDVVVMELQLRGHSGVEFLYEFRSYSEWQTVPVVLHTLVPAQVLRPYKEAFDLLNIKAYAYKPATSLQKFVSTIERVLPARA